MVFFDHVYVDMFRELRCRLVVRLMSSCVLGVLLVKISGFVNGFIKDQSLCGPVDLRVGFLQPG